MQVVKCNLKINYKMQMWPVLKLKLAYFLDLERSLAAALCTYWSLDSSCWLGQVYRNLILDILHNWQTQDCNQWLSLVDLAYYQREHLRFCSMKLCSGQRSEVCFDYIKAKSIKLWFVSFNTRTTTGSNLPMAFF